MPWYRSDANRRIRYLDQPRRDLRAPSAGFAEAELTEPFEISRRSATHKRRKADHGISRRRSDAGITG